MEWLLGIMPLSVLMQDALSSDLSYLVRVGLTLPYLGLIVFALLLSRCVCDITSLGLYFLLETR